MKRKKHFFNLRAPLPLWEMLRFLSSHDYFPLLDYKKDKAPEVTIQKYVDGRSANTMFACWQGEVIDTVSVETLFASDPLGSSTIIRTIDNSEMQASRASPCKRPANVRIMRSGFYYRRGNGQDVSYRAQSKSDAARPSGAWREAKSYQSAMSQARWRLRRNQGNL